MWQVSKGEALPSPPVTARSERQHRFEAMYMAHHGPILGYVLRRTDNPDDAADVIGEVFLTAWRRLDDMPGDDQARLWLYGVARRVLANHHRGERRRTCQLPSPCLVEDFKRSKPLSRTALVRPSAPAASLGDDDAYWCAR
jgi:DNA-directed RNA polymerase specialized sigma24 family protein